MFRSKNRKKRKVSFGSKNRKKRNLWEKTKKTTKKESFGSGVKGEGEKHRHRLWRRQPINLARVEFHALASLPPFSSGLTPFQINSRL